MKSRLFKLLSKIHFLLSYIIPKKRNYYVFTPLHYQGKLSGNIKAILLYLNQYEKNIEKAVIVKDVLLKNEVNKIHIKTLNKFVEVHWSLLRAQHIFTDSVNYGYLETGNFSVIQLWHGTGFKNIALLDDNVTEAHKCKLKQTYATYSLIVGNSLDDKNRKEDSFNSQNVVITGTPRNDVFFNNDIYFKEIKSKYNLEGFEKIITYVPTYRDFETIFPFTNDFWHKLQKHLEEENIAFIVKKHPVDKYLEVPSGLPNIKDLTDILSDVQDLLGITDILISDYSGIVTDFVIRGKPVLIYAYDFKTYLETCRSFYYDLEEILPKPFIKNERELLEKIIDSRWFKDSETIESYDKFRKQFHHYLDGNSSKRVIEEVKKL